MSRLDRYQNPDVYEALAAEYVLGTLHGEAREHFERLIAERPYIKAAVAEWSARLNPLLELVPETQPPAKVWQNIQAEIQKTQPKKENWLLSIWKNVGLWRFGAIAMSLVLASLLVLPQLNVENRQNEQVAAQTTPVKFVVLLEDQHSKPMAVAMGMPKPWRLKVEMLDKKPMPEGLEMQLWCLMEDGPPLPMGIVAGEKETIFKLDEQSWSSIQKIEALAISVEPEGMEVPPQPREGIKYKGKMVSF